MIFDCALHVGNEVISSFHSGKPESIFRNVAFSCIKEEKHINAEYSQHK